MRPMPTTSMVLPPSSSSRCVRSPIMPRQNFLCWLSRASGRRRATARISAIACSATARALTPAALASRTLFAASCSLEYWSMPELIDWMNLSLRRARDEVVLPHARDHDDIGLADPLLQIVVVPDLEVADAGFAQVEARLHLVGGVCETDGQILLWPETCVLPSRRHDAVHQKRSGRKGCRSTVVGWPVASSATSLPVMPAMVRPR